MNKKILISVFGILILLIGMSFASAALCKNSRGYYEDCSSSYSGYKKYNTRNTASTPIFKGSYGNYRYTMYENGDYRAGQYFTNYGTGGSGYRVFGGGYGGYYGGYGYRSWGYYRPFFSWFW